MIAVACGNDIFYQDFNNRLVFHLCKLQVSNAGRVHAIEWAGEGRENFFASGSTTGVVQVWDAGYQGGAGKFMRMWREDHETGVGGLSWSEDLLAVGSHDGTISLFDVRKKTNARRVSAHKGKVLGVKWSMDGSLFASGDDLGNVYVWDKRAGKQLLDDDTHGPKLRHRGPVKVLFISLSSVSVTNFYFLICFGLVSLEARPARDREHLS
jgi:cell division cycle protein 20 (cofactor of APC complex)